ncbi:substrate-binding periplasmic protein [Helicovermis profundi]|uniref:Solute-binding protein family 3/N-terminal domain-containing protein n=1 Tax=Helicovermis profundi TaxID=3065157 RepID=A0AAU9E6Y1_9FIRM|nr:hypothetical protein HLPR_07330 [Clostridia bacterium S502]
MKKIFALLLISILVFTGCSIKDNGFTRDLLIKNQTVKAKEVASTSSDTSSSDTSSDTVKREKLVFAIGEWAPYVSETIDNQGFTTEIVKKAFDEVNIDTEFKFYTWAKTLKEVNSHNSFATFPWSFNKDRAKDFLFTDPITVSETKLMYLDGGNAPKDYTDIKSLKKYKIGGVKDYSYVSLFDKENIEIDISLKEDEAIKKLYNKRIDLLPASPLVAHDFITKTYPNEIEKFKFLKTPIESLDMGLLVDKNYPNAKEYIQKFNEGLAKLKATGDYDKILQKHGYGFLVADKSSVDVSSTYASIDPITITTGEYAPFVSESLLNQGFTSEIIKRAFELTNVKVDFKFYAWAKAKAEIENKNAFGSYPWSITDERKAKYAFTDPIVSSTSSFFYLKSNKNIPSGLDFTTFKDLKKYKIGGVKNFFYVDPLEKAGIKADLADKESDSMNKLINGRIDLYPGDVLTSLDLMKSDFKDQIDNIDWFKTPFSTTNYAIMISKDYPNNEEYIKRFNEGLAMMKKSGEFQQILDKHGYGFLGK